MSEIRKSDHYDRKYASGDFKYNPDREREWLRKHIIERFEISACDTILDLGCGKGLHASLLAEFGPQVYGVDMSTEGIRGAKGRGSRAVFINASASELGKYFDHGYFDLIYCRGMSWFHRELDRLCPTTGVNVSDQIPYFMRFIRPGGLFVLQICTDFSGSRPTDNVHNNRLSDYIDLFQPHGEIACLTNWEGTALIDDEQAAEVKGGILIATRKA